MRRSGFAVGCVLFLAMGYSCVSAAEVSEQIPDDVLVAVVVKDMGDLHTKIVDLANKVVEGQGQEIPDFWDFIIDTIKIRRQKQAAGADQANVQLLTSIDRKRPVVLLVPNPGEVRDKNAMLAIMVPVTDYAKFLKEVAEVASTPDDVRTPGQSVDGFDLIGDDRPGEGVYLLKRVDYAVLALSADALKALNRNGKTLQQTLTGQAKKTFTESDVAIYANCDQAVTTFQTDIENFMQALEAQMAMAKKRAEENGAQPEAQPMDIAKILGAEFDVALQLGKQIDHTVCGININQGDVQTTCLMTATPDSGVAKFLAAQKSGSLKLLSTFDKDAWMAGSFFHASGSTKALQEGMLKFLTDSGLTSMMKDFDFNAYSATVMEIDDLLNGDVVFALYPPAEKGGIINMVEVLECKDPERMRTSLQKYLSTKMTGLEGAGLTFTDTVTLNVEPGIDRVVTEFKETENQNNANMKQMAMMMKAIYGEKISAHVMVAGKNALVVTVGDPTTKTIKAVAAKVAAGQPGTLTNSNGFQKALAGLPTQRNGLGYLSFTGLVRAVGPVVMGLFAPDAPPLIFQMPALADESGVGMTWGFTENTLRFDCRIPAQEIVNVRKMIEQAAQDIEGGQK